MNIELLYALMGFAVVSSITPGPNNLMLMSSGANYGFKSTIPHMLGVGLGFTFMIALVGLGIMQLFDAFPITYSILKIASLIYLVYLAIKIATAGPANTETSRQSRPMTFMQAAAFQWVNPKAWTMALTAISVYAPSHSLIAVLTVALVFGALNIPCITSWILLGQKIQVFLTNPIRLRVFNIIMALMLLGSLYPALV